jgi:CRP-like cAMP-binding protein
MEKLEKMLGEHPFFKGLDVKYLDVIKPGASSVQYQAGEMIYKEGDQADQFLLIRNGRVSVEIFAPPRGSLVVETIGADDVLGWSWLFPPYVRRFDARAIELTRAVALEGKALREKSETDPVLGYELLRRFSKIVVERLQAMRLQLVDIYGKHT